MKDIANYLGKPKLINSYSSARLRDKDKMLNLISKGCVIQPSVSDHYVVVGGRTFNGFSLEEIKRMCGDLEIEYEIGGIYGR